MKLLELFLYSISRLPFPVLHRCSDLLFLVVYHGFGYRKKVVNENLRKSFPEKSASEIERIQRQFYRNFCDLIFETIKTISISNDEIRNRCQIENPEILHEIFSKNLNVNGISSHMGNWEWLSLSLSLETSHRFLAVYKPLAMKNLNEWVIRSRERFGARFVPIKKLKAALDEPHSKPYFVGLLSDQAPHDYSKSFEFEFLNQKTYFVTGPGVITVQRNLLPLMGWIRRVGRSRYLWKLERVPESAVLSGQRSEDVQQQIERISEAHSISIEAAETAYQITEHFVKRLEEEIKMAPQDWLWSHRRWKSR